MCGFTPNPPGGGVPESLLAMGTQNMYHLSLLGESKASCPTGAEITWGLGALDPLGDLYAFLESSHGLPQPHPQGPNACLPSETIPQPSSLPLSPKLWWTGNSRGLTDCRSHLARGYMSFLFFQSLLLSASIKREGESPTASPHSSTTDDLHHSDRYQVRRGWVSVRRKPLWMRA